MASRDINFIIKAKDEASRAINSMADAFDALTGKQAGATSTSKALGGSIAELVAQMAQFEKVSGLVTQASDRAEASIERQRKTVKDTASELEYVTRQIANAQRAIQALPEKIVSVGVAGGDTTKLAAALTNIKSELASLEGQQSKLSSTLTKQQAALTEQENSFRELALMANSAEAAVNTFGSAEDREALRIKATTEAIDRQTAAMREQAQQAKNAAVGATINRTTNAVTGKSAADSASVFEAAGLTSTETALRTQETERYLLANAKLEDVLARVGVKSQAIAQVTAERATAEQDAAQKASQASNAEAAAIQRLLDRLNPAAVIQRQLATDIELARQAMARGILTAEQFAKAEADLAMQAKRAEEALNRTNGGGKPTLFGLKPYELTNLGYQVNDVISGFAMGQRPMQILAQQGGQILQLMPKVGGAITAAFTNPYFLGAAAVFIAISVAIKRAADNAEQLKQIQGILLQMGDGAKMSATELQTVVKSMEDIGLSSAQAIGLLRDFATQGLNPAYLQAFAKAAKDTSQVTGQDLKSSITEVEGAFTKGYKAVAEMDDKMQFLTRAERDQIRAMFDSGQASEARTLAFQRYLSKMDEIAAKSRGEWSESFRELGNSLDALLDRFSNTGLIQGFEHAIEQVARGAADTLTPISEMTAEQVQRGIQGINTNRANRQRYGSTLGKGGSDPYLTSDEEARLEVLNARLDELERKAAQTNGDTVAKESAARQKRVGDLTQEINAEERLQQLRDKTTKLQQVLTKSEQDERLTLAGNAAFKAEMDKSGLEEVATLQRRNAVEKEQGAIIAENRAAAKAADAERKKAISDFTNAVVGAEGGPGQNPFSTAKGYGQFTNGTWLDQFKKVFPARAGGMSDDAILALRTNQQIAKAIIDNYAKENARFLERFGQQVTAGNLYLAHFLGAAGALKVLKANPNSPVDALLGGLPNGQKILSGNQGYLRLNGGKGRYRTAGELRDFIANRVGDTGSAQASGEAALAQIEDQRRANQEKFNQSVEKENENRLATVGAMQMENTLWDDKLVAAQRQAAIDKAALDLQHQMEDANRGLAADDIRRVQVTKQQVDETKRLAAAEFDAVNARRLAEAQKSAAERPVNSLTTDRSAIEQQISVLRDLGDASGADALLSKVQGINAELVKAIDNLIQFYQTMSPEKAKNLGLDAADIDAAKAGLEVLKAETLNWHDTAAFAAKDIQSAFAGSLSDAFKGFASDLAHGENLFKSLGKAALSFAASFLEKLADMGIQLLAFQAASKLGFHGLANGFNNLFGVATGTGKEVGAASLGGKLADTATNTQMTAVATALSTAAGSQSAAATTLSTAAATLQAAASRLLANAATAASMSAAGGGGGGIFGAILGVAKSFIPGAGLTADVASTIAANPAIFHDGGIAGMGASHRFVSPAWFQHAIRYHGGGLAGLKPDEVPAILQRGEEVLTRSSPRHRANGGATGGRVAVPTQILAFNEDDLANAMKTAAGERVFITWIRSNRETVRQMINE